MKIWFDYCWLKGFLEDSDIKFGIGWYQHHKDHRWRGFTVSIYLYKWIVFFNFVDNWKEYDKRMNLKRDLAIMHAEWGERLRKIRESKK